MSESTIFVCFVVDWLWHNPVTVIVLLWLPFVLKISGDLLDAALSREDILVNAEVCNSIVLDLFLLELILSNNPLVFEAALSPVDALVSFEDIVILSKVGYFVVHWVSLCLVVWATG